MKRALVTGLGLVSPLGSWPGRVAENLVLGRSGLRETADQGLLRLGVPGLGPVDVQVPDGRDRVEHLALLAARGAMDDSGLSPAELPERSALCISTSKGAVTSLEGQLAGRFPPGAALERLAPDVAGRAVAGELGIRGQVLCLPAACATGLVSVLAAAREIESGRAELALAGAAEASLTAFIHGAFAAMGVLAAGGELAPGRAVRPFDRDRRGFLLGEGAAVFVLESAERAGSRGARVRASLAGGAELCDARSLAAPDPEGAGLAAAARLALSRAGLKFEEIDGLWLHGTATRSGDPAELRGLAALAGRSEREIPATATKGLTGHMLGASGAVELALAVLALGEGFLPAVANLEAPLSSPGLGLVRGSALELPARRYLVLSAGFGGHLAAAVVEAPRGGNARAAPRVDHQCRRVDTGRGGV